MTQVLEAQKNDPWKASTMTLRRVIEEAPSVKTFEFSFDDSRIRDSYVWQPGQFNMLYVPGVGEVAISISGEDRSRGVIRHTIRRIGLVTAVLDESQVGTAIGLRGPFGSAWPIDRVRGRDDEPRDVIIVAGGIGLVPLRPAIQQLLEHPQATGDVSLLIGARAPADLLFAREYPRWRGSGARIQTTVDRMTDHWIGHVGVVTLLLERLSIARPHSTLVMMCGPEVMMRYVAQMALQRGIDAGNLWLSLERHMNCAVGLCGHCQLGPTFICKDGPVFEYNQISDWLNVRGF